jgi:long-chain fatty acid transport protein
MRKHLVLSVISALVATGIGTSARANEADTYGLGSRAAALGGAVAADATDFSGNYYNPAALVGAQGLSLAVGYLHVENNLRIDDHDNAVAPAHGIVGGLVAPGKLFGVPFAFGLATFMPDAGLSRIKALRQETPRWAIYDDRASIVFLAVNLAIRPVPWLDLGGGVAFLAATQGRFAITGSADIVHQYESKLTHEVDADLTSIRYPQVGARIKIADLGYLGLVYRGQTKLELGINAKLSGTVLAIPLRYELASHTIDAFLPQQVVLGASFQKIRNLKVNVDLTFVNWAAYESPTAQTRAHLALDLPALMLPPDPKPTVVIAPAFENRFVPRVGVEYTLAVGGSTRRVHDEDHRLVEIPLRAGYVFERSPVPPQTGVTNFVDADRHTMSLGAGVILNAPFSVFPGRLELDVHGQLSVLPERVTHKDNPADFVGDYRAAGTMVGLGSTLSAVF